MEERATFKFFRSFLDAALMLPDKEQQADFLIAVCKYGLDGEEQQIEGVPAALFALAKPNLDASRKKSESGAVGGSNSQAKRKQNSSKTQADDKQTSSKVKAKPKQPSTEVGSRKKEVGSKEVGGITPLPPSSDEDRVQLAPLVSMTVSDHEKLIERFGAADTKRLVEILDNYKGSSGKKYKDDYRAILSWCVDRLDEEKSKVRRPVNGPTYSPPSEAENARAREDMERLKRLMMREGGNE